MNQSYITKVYLLDVPLESDYKNTLYFANASAQQTYFQSRIIKSYTDFSYQRKDRIIRIPDIIDNIYHCNYVMYQNSNYSNKWFYAFIDKMEYINDGRTDVTISTDVMQTWVFDITIKPSFVEREHVDDDTFGLHTIPENLDTGDYISCNAQPTKSYVLSQSSCCFVLATTDLLTGFGYGGQNSFAIPLGLYYIGVTTNLGLQQLILEYDKAGKGESISSVFIAPKEFFSTFHSLTIDGTELDGTFSFTIKDPSFTSTINISRPNYIGNNYTPRNNKLLTYPYNFLQVSNLAGTVVNYNWENFNYGSSGTNTFQIEGTITPGCSFKVYPKNYNNLTNDYDDGLSLSKLPIGSYKSDVYYNWLRQNGLNIGLNMLSSGAEVLGGLGMMATGGGAMAGASMVASGSLGIANSLTQSYQHSLIPPQIGGNANCGDVTYQFDEVGLYFKRMSIKNEYAQVIDQYFDMFGYKVNTVKVPNKNHRQRWWYTKTIDVNIDGAIPDEDMQKIKDNYNKGITFWKNASEMDNYTLSNNIV